MSKRFDPVSGKIFSVFFYYAIPSLIGVIAMSFAVVVDGFFIGNYGGATALAAVNLTEPVLGLLFGIAVMLSVGGSARCAKYLGTGDHKSANGIFTLTLTIAGIIALCPTIAGLLFMDRLVHLLGANTAITNTVTEYLSILLLFNVSQTGVVCLAYFMRVDNRPLLASMALVFGSLLNVLLDWFFVAEMHMEHKGAALGTGLSELATFIILATPFLMRKTKLRFTWRKNQILEVFKAAPNGFAEFSNEISSSIMILIMNWVIMRQLGENGIAAFSIINYLILCALLISCGVSESLLPVVSKNFGALNHKRITSFLMISLVSVFTLGLLTSGILLLAPGIFIKLFINAAEKNTINYTLHFISRIWPIFLLSGLNIILSSYLTAMHQALSSTVIALARGLVLPILFLLCIRLLTSYDGILIVMPLSEMATLALGLILLRKNSPARLIQQQRYRLGTTHPVPSPAA